jgi:glycosyltransferase involved in cell wall biosynthesis
MSLRILQIVEAILAGTGRYVSLLTTGLDTNQFHVEVACPLRRQQSFGEDGFVAGIQQAGYKVWPITLRRDLHPLYDCLALQQLLSLLRSSKPDIVHTHSSKAGFLGRLAARRTGVPTIIHMPHGLYFLGQRNVVKRNFYLLLERLAAQWCDIIIATSASERDQLVRWKIMPASKIVVIENGIEPMPLPTPQTKQALRTHYQISNDSCVIATLGRVTAQKNPVMFIQAAAQVAKQYPQTSFVWIGGGELLEQMQVLARSLGIADRCRFLGHQDNGRELLGMADIFWLPSAYEGFSFALLEAMALGLPIIATDVVGNRDALIQGQSGLLIPPNDVEALVAATAKLLAQPTFAESLGRGARTRLLTHFTLQQTLQRTSQLYLDLVAARPTSDR